MRKILVSILIIFISLVSFSEFTEKNEPLKLEKQYAVQSEKVKLNPFLYNNWVGLLMDGVSFTIPLGLYAGLVMANAVPDSINQCATCITIPIGAVITEKFIKSLLINGINKNIDKPYSNLSAFANLGAVNYLFGNTGGSANEIDFGYADITLFSKFGISYKYNLNESFSLLLNLEQYSAIVNNLKEYYSVGLGVGFGDYVITIDNVVYGREKPSALEKIESTIWIGKFPGIGLGWAKRFYMYRGLFIEPGLQLKVAGAINDSDHSLLGIFGGINIGYKF